MGRSCTPNRARPTACTSLMTASACAGMLFDGRCPMQGRRWMQRALFCMQASTPVPASPAPRQALHWVLALHFWSCLHSCCCAPCGWPSVWVGVSCMLAVIAALRCCWTCLLLINITTRSAVPCAAPDVLSNITNTSTTTACRGHKTRCCPSCFNVQQLWCTYCLSMGSRTAGTCYPTKYNCDVAGVLCSSWG